MDSGGDAVGNNLTAEEGFWTVSNPTGDSSISINTSTAETGSDSLSFTSGSSATSGAAAFIEEAGILAAAGRRISTYVNFGSLPTGNLPFLVIDNSAGTKDIFDVTMASDGTLKLYSSDPNAGGTQ